MKTKHLNVYLAGKVKGNKWSLIKNINPKNISFISSDGESESTWKTNDDGAMYHGYKYRHAHEKQDGLSWDADGMANEIINDSIYYINRCNFLIAYIDKHDSYGSIAEIAYASGKSKPIYMIIKSEEGYFYPCNDDEKGETPDVDMIDSYWFISNFPNVVKIFVNSEEGGKDIVEKICNLQKTQSPIEESFLIECFQNHMFNIQPQYKVGRYFADFALPEEKILIELDGHEFHNTKEQRTSDAKRQRFLQSSGWNVIRFTGTEIYKSVNQCYKELIELIKSKGVQDEMSEVSETLF